MHDRYLRFLGMRSIANSFNRASIDLVIKASSAHVRSYILTVKNQQNGSKTMWVALDRISRGAAQASAGSTRKLHGRARFSTFTFFQLSYVSSWIHCAFYWLNGLFLVTCCTQKLSSSLTIMLKSLRRNCDFWHLIYGVNCGPQHPCGYELYQEEA